MSKSDFINAYITQRGLAPSCRTDIGVTFNGITLIAVQDQNGDWMMLRC